MMEERQESHSGTRMKNRVNRAKFLEKIVTDFGRETVSWGHTITTKSGLNNGPRITEPTLVSRCKAHVLGISCT